MADKFDLVAEFREDTGKGASRRLRRQEKYLQSSTVAAVRRATFLTTTRSCTSFSTNRSTRAS